MKRIVEVTVMVMVEVDEAAFTPEFMAEFRHYMHPFDTVDEHALFLANLAARGVIDGDSSEFVEGYGELGKMGIRAAVLSSEDRFEGQP